MLSLLQLLVTGLPTNVLFVHGPRDLHGLGQAAVGDAAEPANGPQDGGVDEVALLVDGVLADPKVGALEHDEAARLLAGRGAALELAHALDAALDREDGLADARGFHVAAVPDGREAAHVPLAGAVRGVDAGRVGRLHEPFADDVDGALLALEQVLERVLGLFDAAGEAEHEQRGVVVHHVEVAKRRQVGDGTVGAGGAHEADGSRHDARDEQLVVEGRRAAGLVGVNSDVLFVVAIVQLVGAAAKLPLGLGRLGVVERGIRVPVGARGLDLFEVGVRVALDLGLGGRRHRHCAGLEFGGDAVRNEGR